MNVEIPVAVSDLWSLAAWTMVHFLWLGAAAAVIAYLGRLALRPAGPNIRYAYALASLAIIAAIPIATAAWLSTKPSPYGRGQGEGALALEPIAQQASPQPTIELHTPANDLTTAASAPTLTPTLPPTNFATTQPSTLDQRLSTTADLQPSTAANIQPSTLNLRLYHFIPYLPWLWLIGTPLTFTLLVTGLIGTRRLHHASTIVSDGPLADALARLTTSLRITRRVTIAVCERVAAPVLIGIVRPMILLPPAALTGWSPDEIEMVLLHELAHVRRYDNLVNLAQRVIESLLFFHPAVWIVSTWVRREREACCDAAVVTRTQQPHAYAELLLNIASRLSEPGRPRPRPFSLLRDRGRSGSLTMSSPMAHGPLRRRIHHILQLEDDPMLISGKSLALTIATLLTAAALAVLYVPKIGHAEPSTTEATENTESKKEDSKERADKATTAEAEQPTTEKPDSASKGKTLAQIEAEFRADRAKQDKVYQGGYSDFQMKQDLLAWELEESDLNPVETRKYDLSEAEREVFHKELEDVRKQPSWNPQHKLEVNWDAKPIEITSTRRLHEFLSALLKERHQVPATTDDWPRGIVFPSPKEGGLSAQLYRMLGIKVVVAKDVVNSLGHQLKVIGGLELPPNAQGTVFLDQINDTEVKTYDDLAGVLTKVATSPKVNIRCYTQNRTFGGAQTVMFNRWMDNKLATSTSTAPPQATSSKFPSLEDQKLADLAFKRLGLELEPIGDDDLQRVKALGYDGGVKVTDVPSSGAFGPSHGDIEPNDILVGLHAWPTTNMKQVVEILRRNDLAELNPLKYYVIRQETVHSQTAPPQPHDEVRSGRISVQISDSTEGASATENAPSTGHRSDSQPTSNWSAIAPRSPFAPTPATRYSDPGIGPQVVETPADPLRRSWHPHAGQPLPVPTIPNAVNGSPPTAPPLNPGLTNPTEPMSSTGLWPRAPVGENAWPTSPPSDDVDPYRATGSRKRSQTFAEAPSTPPATFQALPAASEPSAPKPGEHSLLARNNEAPPLATQPNEPAAPPGFAYRTRITPGGERVREIVQSGQANATPAINQDSRAALVYDGKDFTAWSNNWRTELSTDKRLEAVKALAAFGNAGYGQEAAEAILNVAAEYDWSHTGGNDSLQHLRTACIDAFGGSGNSLATQLPAENAIDVLIHAADSKRDSQRQFAAIALQSYGRTSTPAMEAICQLSRCDNEAIRTLAWDSLTRCYSPNSPAALKRVREALTGKDTLSQVAALRTIWVNDAKQPARDTSAKGVAGFPEVDPLLFSPDAAVRREARIVLLRFTDDAAARIVPQLRSVLNDESRNADHIEAIRALAALRDRARPSTEVLEKALVKDTALRIPAATALKSILGEIEFNKLLGRTIAEELQIRVNDVGTIFITSTGGVGPFYDFQQSMNEEKKAVGF